MPEIKVSLITTVKNEGTALPRLLDSLQAQTRLPDQVIISDGGSSDNTRQVIQQYKRNNGAFPAAHRAKDHAAGLTITLLDCPGANISQGRNAAIADAWGEIIACTDAGVRLDAQWLEQITLPFRENNPPDVVSGFFVPDPHGAFETALAATTLPALRDIKPERFLPSSRSIAFRKSAWAAIQGYPEWLDYCEDLIFDFALRARGFRFAFVPEARVYFRPRSTLIQFFRQYYHYARGDGKANLWLKRHLLRYATYLFLLPLTITLAAFQFWLGAALFIVGAIVMFGTPYTRLVSLWQGLSIGEKIAALLWVPIIRITGDVAKMVGYPVGVWWRRSNKR